MAHNPILRDVIKTPVRQRAKPRSSRLSMRGRVGRHPVVQNMGAAFTGTIGPNGKLYTGSRILTDEQCWLAYRLCADLRAGIDSIVRRVSTHNYRFKPIMDESSSEHEAAMQDVKDATAWFKTPDLNGTPIQDLIASVVRDMLVVDVGAIEMVYADVSPDDRVYVVKNPEGQTITTLDLSKDIVIEITDLMAESIFPVEDQHGRLLGYKQAGEGWLQGIGASWDGSVVRLKPGEKTEVTFSTEQVAYLPLSPNSRGVRMPLIETIVNEIASSCKMGERILGTVDRDEIGAGVLMIMGVEGDEFDDMVDDLKSQSKAADGSALRVLSAPESSNGASWVPFTRSMTEDQLKDVMAGVAERIWRVLGVMPVEMGRTENSNRAVGEVQIDASGSHLLGPILERLAAAINSQLLLKIPGGEQGRILFEYDLEQGLTPIEQEAKSKSLNTVVSGGMMTPNEARTELDLLQVDGGDTLRLPKDSADAIGILFKEGIVSLNEARAVAGFGSVVDGDEVKGAAKEEPEEPPDGQPDDGGSKSGGEGANEVDDGDASEVDAPGEARGKPQACACGRTHNHRALGDVPKGWQRASDTPGDTLNLPALAADIEEYQDRIDGYYETMSGALVTALRVALRDRRAPDWMGAKASISDEMDRLAIDWAVSTNGIYGSAVRNGETNARSWLDDGDNVDFDGRQFASLYAAAAMGYLVDENGLLSDLRAAIDAMLDDAKAGQNGGYKRIRWEFEKEAEEVDDDNVIGILLFGAILAAAGAITNHNQHRVNNWSGKINEVGHDAARQVLLLGGHIGKDLSQMWVNWNAIHDETTCPDCDDEGSMGWREAGSLHRSPGSDTRCGARCRCFLEFATLAELVRMGLV